MPPFHHPYNFIPATGKINGRPPPKTEWRPNTKYDPGQTGARHDLWLPHTFSGRVVCRLRLETPTVVGGEHTQADESSHTVVKPYTRNGQPAIPGNSLRGMIDSTAETLSQSTLRVLENRRYSVRKPVKCGLSAIGRLIASLDPEERSFDLVPLTVPTLPAERRVYRLPEKWQQVFGKARLGRSLPAYVDGYEEGGTPGQPKRRYIANSFLDPRQRDDSLRIINAFGSNTKDYYYARLTGVQDQSVSDPIPAGSSGLREKNCRLLGQWIQDGDSAILSQEEYEQLDATGRSHYTKGILRVLGIAGRETEIPKTKKHEVFIPISNNPRIPVRQEALNKFIDLANERFADSKGLLPFALQGYRGKGDDPDWAPESAQLFFFDVQLDDNHRPYVSEISISSIWRKQIDDSAWDFFEAIDPDLVPWNSERQNLTPAELLFGVVEDRERTAEEAGEAQEPSEEPPARALASRVRFHDALPLPGTKVQIATQPVTLKILSSPKPPSPAMYFHRSGQAQGDFISKIDLAKARHHPNGRKVYLHHHKEDIENARWESGDSDPRTAGQKMQCSPLTGGDFYFHIDFDNLSKAELTLLLTSLRPSARFRHRLGLGKSLGLGTVEVAIEGVFFVGRHQRYGRTALTEPRYHGAWREDPIENPTWSSLYPEEAERVKDAAAGGPLEQQTEYYDRALIDNATWELVNTVGDPTKLQAGTAVQQPLCDDQLTSPANERETFRWFVENEKNDNPQALPAIETENHPPVMNTYARARRNTRQR